MSEHAKMIWPCINYLDAHKALDWLVEVLGFDKVAVHTDGSSDVIVHSELRWPEGGGVMVGQANRPDSEFSQMPTGAASCYVVTDEPDAVFARATAGGAEVVRGLVDQDYGSREFSVRDFEGNLWSFGTYRGE